MARLRSNPYLLSGKVGNQVFRIRNGKVYVCALPRKYKKSQTKAARAGREKFSFFVKLAKAIKDNYILDHEWKKLKLPGSTSNKIMKTCYPLVAENYSLGGFKLVEKADFGFTIKEASITSREITVVVNPLSSDQKISVCETPYLSAQGLIYLKNMEYKRKDKFVFYPIASPDVETLLDQELIFKFKITYRQYKQLNLYPERELILNLARKSSGEALSFSYTDNYSF